MRDEHKTRPRLAFVLGSGGVRSIAAIGIAEVLAAAGIRPDLIVGCSSGALFGATLALGQSGREALHTATSLWSAELTQQHRWRAYAQLLAPRWFGFDASFALRDDRRIEERIRRAFGERRLEDLPTPLRVVATEARIDAARSAGQSVFEIELGLDRHVGLWETRAMPYLFNAGRHAARAQLGQIAALLGRSAEPEGARRDIAA